MPANAIRVGAAGDCSSDSTAAIVCDLARRRPDVEVHILYTTSKLGITRNYRRGFAACTAEYVAVLEGDHYWCGRNYLVLDDSGASFVVRVAVGDRFDVFDSRALIDESIIVPDS